METVTKWLCPQEFELDVDVRRRWDALRAVGALNQTVAPGAAVRSGPRSASRHAA